MNSHKCTCTFIPPFVFEHMSKSKEADKETREEATKALAEDEERRGARAKTLEAAAGVAAGAKNAKREVYDSGNQYAKRVTLVREEGGPVTADSAVTCAYEYAGLVRAFYKDILGRASIDNDYMDLILNVHYGVRYNNAFWDGDEMTFGDGDDRVFTGFVKSLDVVAHELTHGVTQFEASLIYRSQSGALNEHFSDVFGTVITQHANGQTAHDADWLIGDEIMGPLLYGESLRSMSAPGTAYDNALMGKDPQPAHMRDYYAGPGDNQGVHINSGIPNRAFYLTSMTIGTDKAALIWYTALQKLKPQSQFNDAVAVIVESARLLTHSGQVGAGSTQTVRAAFREVGLPS